MAATETQTVTQLPAEPTEPISPPSETLKSFDKVYGVPIVKDFITLIHSTLSNGYLASAYSTGLGVGSQALEYSKYAAQNPYVAPLVDRADKAVLEGLNAAEARFPYPFQTTSEKMYADADGQFDFHVRSPVIGFASSADAKLAPILDQLEAIIDKSKSTDTDASINGTSSDGTQVSRAIRLGVKAKDQFVTLSADQVHQLQQQSTIVQQATESVYKLSESLQAIGKNYSEKVNSVSSDILTEVEKVKSSVLTLPKHLQTSIQPLQSQLASSATDIQKVTHSDATTTREKASQVASTVQNQIGPVFEAIKESISLFAKPVKVTNAPSADGAN